LNIKTHYNIDELIQINKGIHNNKTGYIKAFKLDNNKHYYKIQISDNNIKIWISEYNIKSLKI
jgi:hypothetical protein